MANFTCQTNLATACTDIHLNVFLGVPLRVYLDDISIWVGRMRKADRPPNVLRHLPICVGGPEKKIEEGRSCSLPPWAETTVFSCTLVLYSCLLLRLLDSHETGFPGLQPTDSMSRDFSPSRILWAHSSLYVSSASLLTPTNSLAYYVRGYFWLFHWEQMWTICLLKHTILQKNALNMIEKIS